MTRATVSGNPPGAYGTTKRIDLLGYPAGTCARASVAGMPEPRHAIARNNPRITMRRCRTIDFLQWLAPSRVGRMNEYKTRRLVNPVAVEGRPVDLYAETRTC